MSDLRELLRSEAATPRAAPDFGALLGRVRRRRRQRAIAWATTLSLVSALVATLLAITLGHDRSITMIPPATSESPVTTEPATTAPKPTVPTPSSVVEVATATTTPDPSTTTSTSAPSTTTTSPPIVTGPNGLRLVNVRIVGPNGTPFPKGTVEAQACPVSGDPCVYGQAVDGAGTVALELDPAVRYNINGMVRNTGLPNPWISPSGVPFHFSEGIERSGSELRDGTVLVIKKPSS